MKTFTRILKRKSEWQKPEEKLYWIAKTWGLPGLKKITPWKFGFESYEKTFKSWVYKEKCGTVTKRNQKIKLN